MIFLSSASFKKKYLDLLFFLYSIDPSKHRSWIGPRTLTKLSVLESLDQESKLSDPVETNALLDFGSISFDSISHYQFYTIHSRVNFLCESGWRALWAFDPRKHKEMVMEAFQLLFALFIIIILFYKFEQFNTSKIDLGCNICLLFWYFSKRLFCYCWASLFNFLHQLFRRPEFFIWLVWKICQNL